MERNSLLKLVLIVQSHKSPRHRYLQRDSHSFPDQSLLVAVRNYRCKASPHRRPHLCHQINGSEPSSHIWSSSVPSMAFIMQHLRKDFLRAHLECLPTLRRSTGKSDQFHFADMAACSEGVLVGQHPFLPLLSRAIFKWFVDRNIQGLYHSCHSSRNNNGLGVQGLKCAMDRC